MLPPRSTASCTSGGSWRSVLAARSLSSNSLTKFSTAERSFGSTQPRPPFWWKSGPPDRTCSWRLRLCETPACWLPLRNASWAFLIRPTQPAPGSRQPWRLPWSSTALCTAAGASYRTDVARSPILFCSAKADSSSAEGACKASSATCADLCALAMRPIQPALGSRQPRRLPCSRTCFWMIAGMLLKASAALSFSSLSSTNCST